MMLEEIRGPEDLRGLSAEALKQLAAELRQLLIGTVAKTGGHLGPSLGTVELTLALHSVYETPRDQIVWDVGHQAYAHKILTGRREAFGTLRQRGGVSGFPRREESRHDAFGTGHASTAVSAALGIARARDLAGEDFGVAAVVGDGALTGGLSFEGLNQAGHLKSDLVVVLNDNSLSISPNVGAIATYLTRLRTDPTYTRVKNDVEHLLRSIPVIGEGVVRTAERVKDSFRYALVDGALFEALGFRYLGPFDGHQIPLLQEVFRRARRLGGPVLVHVITEKGRGYQPAVADPSRFHGSGPFDPESGKPLGGRRRSYSQVFGETMVELAGVEPRLLAITAAMADGTGLVGFRERFPERFFDVGIAEDHAVVFAAGLATQGWRPVVAVYSTFLQRAFDAVIHDVALQGLPVVFAIDRAGLVGDDGPTHHGTFDLAYLRPIPNLVIAAPRDEAELSHMLRGALGHPGPVVLRYPRGTAAASLGPGGLPIGRGEILRSGRGGAILAIGSMVATALEAAEILAKQGLSFTVADARYLKPLDRELVLELAALGPLYTLEEGATGGLGSAVLELLAAEGARGLVETFHLPDRFIEHGDRGQLLAEMELDASGVARRILASAAVPLSGRRG